MRGRVGGTPLPQAVDVRPSRLRAQRDKRAEQCIYVRIRIAILRSVLDGHLGQRGGLGRCCLVTTTSYPLPGVTGVVVVGQ